MTVYVVMDGDWDGDWILGVYASLEKAKAAHPAEWELNSAHPQGSPRDFWFTRYGDREIQVWDVQA